MKSHPRFKTVYTISLGGRTTKVQQQLGKKSSRSGSFRSRTEIIKIGEDGWPVWEEGGREGGARSTDK